MKHQDELIAFLRRYFDGHHETRLSIYLTSRDQDHATWDKRLKDQDASAVYGEAFSAPHHGNGERTKDVIRLLKFWRLRGGVKVHRDVRAGNPILVRPVRGDRPPRVAQFFLFLIPKRSREHLIGDLEEEYRTKVLSEWGLFRAQFFYWEQTTIALICYLWPVLKRILGLVALWKVIGR